MSEKETMNSNEKQQKRQSWTLVYTLVLQTLSFIFWFGPIEFSCKSDGPK
jgi:hypothetical protein